MCNKIEDYFAGVLQGEEKATFKHHLESCSTCQKRLDQLVFLDKELRRVMPRTLQEKKLSSNWMEDLITRVWSSN